MIQVNDIFGDLTVIEICQPVNNHNKWVIVQCSCGTKERVIKYELRKTKKRCKKCNKRQQAKRIFKYLYSLQKQGILRGSLKIEDVASGESARRESSRKRSTNRN